MKIKLISIGLIFIMSGCNPTKMEDIVKGDTVGKSRIETGSPVVHGSSSAIWRYDYDQQTDKFEVIQLRPVDVDTLTGGTLEKIINKNWPKVQIKFLRISNDTAFLSITDSEVLTQQIGTAGAMDFLISTTFSFTELKEIKHVSFDFEEGDHAIPGVYNRNSWDKNKNQ